MPLVAVVPPEELVDPPEEPPDEVEPPDDVVDPPDEDVDPPDEEVEPVLLVLPPELDVEGSVPVPVPAGAGSVPFVSEPRSELGLAKSSLSFAPPQAARTANDDATTALMRRRGVMGMAKH